MKKLLIFMACCAMFEIPTCDAHTIEEFIADVEGYSYNKIEDMYRHFEFYRGSSAPASAKEEFQEMYGVEYDIAAPIVIEELRIRERSMQSDSSSGNPAPRQR
jgi:hypothetical protein